MRLIELQKVITEVNGLLKNFTVENASGQYAITNSQNIKSAILLLRDANLLESELDSEEVQHIINSEGERMVFDEHKKRDKVFKVIKDIQSSVVLLDRWMRNSFSYEQETEDTISVMLPPMNSLDDLLKYTNLVQKGFTSIVNAVDGGIIKFRNLDRGSDWIVFTVGGGSIVFLIGHLLSLISKCIVMSKNYYEMQVMREKLKKEKYDSDFFEKMDEYQKESLKQFMQEEVGKIISEQNVKLKNDDNQDIARIVNGVEELLELIKVGAKVVPALSAADEVKEVFKDQLQLSYNEMKCLSPESNEKDNENQPEDE